MESKRIVKGNKTIIPSGSSVMGLNITNAVTEPEQLKQNMAATYDCVVEAREFMEENKK